MKGRIKDKDLFQSFLKKDLTIGK